MARQMVGDGEVRVLAYCNNCLEAVYKLHSKEVKINSKRSDY